MQSTCKHILMRLDKVLLQADIPGLGKMSPAEFIHDIGELSDRATNWIKKLVELEEMYRLPESLNLNAAVQACLRLPITAHFLDCLLHEGEIIIGSYTVSADDEGTKLKQDIDIIQHACDKYHNIYHQTLQKDSGTNDFNEYVADEPSRKAFHNTAILLERFRSAMVSALDLLIFLPRLERNLTAEENHSSFIIMRNDRLVHSFIGSIRFQICKDLIKEHHKILETERIEWNRGMLISEGNLNLILFSLSRSQDRLEVLLYEYGMWNSLSPAQKTELIETRAIGDDDWQGLLVEFTSKNKI